MLSRPIAPSLQLMNLITLFIHWLADLTRLVGPFNWPVELAR